MLKGEIEGDSKGDFRGDFKQDLEGDMLSSSGMVQVWFRLQLKLNSIELDSEEGRLVYFPLFLKLPAALCCYIFPSLNGVKGQKIKYY